MGAEVAVNLHEIGLGSQFGLRSAVNAAALLETAAQHGVDASRCLEGTGLSAAGLRGSDAEISVYQELSIVRNLVTALGGAAGVGLEAGRRVPLTAYGVLGLGVMSSATGRDAVRFALRHRELLLTLAAPSLEESPGRFATVWDYGQLSEGIQRFLFERDATAYVLLFRERLGLPIIPVRITCTYPAPENRADYERAFGVRPEFGQPRNVIVHRVVDVSRPLPQASPQTTELCDRMCDELAARRRGRAGTAAQVRAVLSRSESALSQEEAAAALTMSPRSLRRRLQEEGTSYREVAEAVRIEQATELLASGLTVAEVATRLGYSEPSGFSHAFKQWTGSSPGAFAQAMATRTPPDPIQA